MGAAVGVTVAVVDGGEVVGVAVAAGDSVAESVVGGEAADVAVVAVVPSVPGDTGAAQPARTTSTATRRVEPRIPRLRRRTVKSVSRRRENGSTDKAVARRFESG
ncbi:hypothetical protein C452_12810 [Haloferax volcanii JCM 10717]|uniref:Uncharacterized protein n=2 Tax=Haloferax volcanii TaxID=2246 RepID=M0HZ07_HALVO|nr:hypothetical protein D320_16959 [Haloferax sp. BAB-2207]ELZ74888.1 hypothetical protein C456_08028 [Haloferax lucentense DSM 14919]ELZ88937.1 hypothetical protein C452_12810 [Haloferax alexandrinus JCM 10717]